MLIELIPDMQHPEQFGYSIGVVEFTREILQEILDNLISGQR